VGGNPGARLSAGLRYRKKAGPNQHFLDVEYFLEMVLPAFDEAFREHARLLMFEFQRSGIEPEHFLPKTGPLSVTPAKPIWIRRRSWHAITLRTTLSRYPEGHGVGHVYNHLYGMPSLLEQHHALGQSFPAPFTVMRLLTPWSMKYQEAVKAYEPYNKLVRPLPDMRKEMLR
jgi:hypothetical protein